MASDVRAAAILQVRHRDTIFCLSGWVDCFFEGSKMQRFQNIVLVTNGLLKNFSKNIKIIAVLCQSKFDCLIYKMPIIKERQPSLNVQADSIHAKLFIYYAQKCQQCYYVFTHLYRLMPPTYVLLFALKMMLETLKHRISIIFIFFQ